MNSDFTGAAASTGRGLWWRHTFLAACLLLLSAPILLAQVSAQRVIYQINPSKVAQGYPVNASSFQFTVYFYFEDAPDGIPETVQWVNAPGGPQNLDIAGSPTSYSATIIAPKAMTNALGPQQIRLCLAGGSVCTNDSDSEALTVITPQVVTVDPPLVTRGVGDQEVYLSYVLPRNDQPAEPPAVYLVNSDGVETRLEPVFQPEPGLAAHVVWFTVPGTFFQSLATYKFRVEEQYDDSENTPQSTNVSVDQATLRVVAPAELITPSPLPPAQLDSPDPDYSYSTFIEASGGSPFSSEEGGDSDGYYDYYTMGDDVPPAGLQFFGSYSNKAELYGRPTGPAGKYSFTVYVQDWFGVVTSKVYRIGIQTQAPALSITTTEFPGATTGLSYSATVSTAGGVAGYEFMIAPGGRGMPDGLTLGSDGSVSGVPAVAGTFLVDVLAEDSQLRQAVRAIPITIHPQYPPLLFSTAVALPDAETGEPYSAKIEAAGGAPPVRIIVGYGLLPAGLAIDAATGIISGIPTTPSETSFLATARDAQGTEISQMFSIRVLGQRVPLSITTLSPLPEGGVGENYSASIVAAGGRMPYLFSVTAGTLPPGLTLDARSGIISGSATQSGAFRFTVQVASADDDETAAREFTIEILGSVRLITQSPLPDGEAGSPYSLAFAVQGGTPPYQFSITDGQLPAGLTLDPESGIVSGVPTAPFSGSFTLLARDSSSTPAVASRTYAIRVLAPLELTVLQLPAGTVNMPYSVQFSAQGGASPYSFSLISGSLPPGITLSSDGLLAGSASAPATATITIQVTDAQGATAQRSYPLRIQTPPVSGSSISLSSSVGVSNSQNEVSVTLSSPQDEEITGEVTLAVNSSATPPVDDPSVQFITGGRSAAFRVPAGQTSAVFGSSPSARFQTGTTAATLVFTATFQRGEQDATPSPAPQASLTIPVTPPTLTDLSVTRSANTLTVVVRGFAPERNISTVILEFARRAGAPGNNPERFEVNVAQAFQQWFGGTASQAFGSQFKLTIPVTLTGDPAEITGLTLRLNGPAGTGNSLSTSF